MLCVKSSWCEIHVSINSVHLLETPRQLVYLHDTNTQSHSDTRNSHPTSGYKMRADTSAQTVVFLPHSQTLNFIRSIFINLMRISKCFENIILLVHAVAHSSLTFGWILTISFLKGRELQMSKEKGNRFCSFDLSVTFWLKTSIIWPNLTKSCDTILINGFRQRPNWVARPPARPKEGRCLPSL